MIKHIALFSTFAVLAGLSLSGCTSVPFITESAPVVNATPAKPAAPKPRDLTALPVGTVLTDAESKTVSRAFEGALRSYALANGTHVLLNRHLPLPDVVQADLDARATADNLAAEGDIFHGWDVAVATMRSGSYRTGKSVVLLSLSSSFITATNRQGTFWAPLIPTRILTPDYSQPKSREAALAIAEAYIAAQPAPGDWVLIQVRR